jgi:hypothetical protein
LFHKIRKQKQHWYGRRKRAEKEEEEEEEIEGGRILTGTEPGS